MSAFIDFLARNIGVIGLILISPALYRLTYGLTLWLCAKLGKNQKDVVIRHYHNGKLVSETVVKADASQPLFVKKYREE
jgi:hypothetical protein